MAKRSTIILKLNKVQVGNETESFLDNCVNEKYSPSDNAIKNIMAFAKAHKAKHTNSIGTVEMVLN